MSSYCPAARSAWLSVSYRVLKVIRSVYIRARSLGEMMERTERGERVSIGEEGRGRCSCCEMGRRCSVRVGS